MNTNPIIKKVSSKNTNIHKSTKAYEQSVAVEESNNSLLLKKEISNISYPFIRNGFNDILKNGDTTKYSELCDLINNFFKLSIKQAGKFYISSHSYNATASLLKMRDGYSFTKDNAAANSQEFFKIISKFLKDLPDNRVTAFIVFTILNCASFHDSIKEQVNSNIKNLIKFRDFISPLYEEIILPNKAIIEKNLSQEDKLILSDELFIFSILNTQEFQSIVELFSNSEMRKISYKFVFNNNSTYFPNFDYLFSNFNGWMELNFLNKIINNIFIVNNVFRTIYQNGINKLDTNSQNQVISLIQSNRKCFINSSITEKNTFYFIDTFFSDTVDEKLMAISLASKYLQIPSIIKHYPNVIDEICMSPMLVQDKNIYAFVYALQENITIKIPTTDEQWLSNLIFFMHHKDIHKFKNLFGIDKFVEKGLTTFSTSMSERINWINNFASILSNDEVMTFFNSVKSIKESTKEQIQITLKLARTLATKESIFSQTHNFIYEKLKDNDYFNDPLWFFNNFNSLFTYEDRAYYWKNLIKSHNQFDLLSSCFDVSRLDITSKMHKMFFTELIPSITSKGTNDIYVKGFIELLQNHPIHKLLDKMIAFYSIEDYAISALDDEDFNLNNNVWTELKSLLLFCEKYYNIIFLQQLDAQQTSIKEKLSILNETIISNSHNRVQIVAYNYSNEIIISRGSKIFFWKKNVYDRNPSYKYLYITPQGPMFSDETLIEFIGDNTPIKDSNDSWKDSHEDKTKQAYLVLGSPDIPTEISLQTKELIRNFKKISEIVEPIKEYLDFEELMFFEQSFFQDILNMLNAQKASSIHAKVLKNMSPSETLTILDQEQQHSLKIIELLQKQMDNISQDLIINLKSKYDFDLAVLAEYIEKRQIK